MSKHIKAAIDRAKKLDAALRAISVSNDIIWGMPAFKGSRVPIDTIVGSIKDGTSFAVLKESYAFLTEDLVEAARIYTEIHPFQEHTQHLCTGNPACKLKNVVIIHPEPRAPTAPIRLRAGATCNALRFD